jgi:hypothetical protein
MNTFDEEARSHNARGGTDVVVQVILGFFLIVAFCTLSWLMASTH